MIPLENAEALVRDNLPPRKTEAVTLENAAGRILLENVLSDRNQPPYHRVTMDGIALSASALLQTNTFSIEGIQGAGEAPKTLRNTATSCLQVMTGAMLPTNCDCVIPIENIQLKETTATVLQPENYNTNSNIHLEASDRKKGETLLRPHTLLKAHHIAIMASVGKTSVRVAAMPRIAVISTGDELVELDVQPKPYQIHASSTWGLLAGLRQQAFPAERFHFPDDLNALQRGLGTLLQQFDILILSGGVSMGLYDLVPQALENLHVKPIFHKIKQRPGKPLWFGTAQQGQPVFGLPGNPVSTLICFHRLVLPMLLQSVGLPYIAAENAILQEPMESHAPLTYLPPARIITDTSGSRKVWPVKYQNSGDFSSLAESHGFIELKRSETLFPTGTIVPFYPWNC